MNWFKIKIATTPKGIDFVSALFEQAGISSLEIEDNEEFLQVLEQTKPQWDFVEDSLYEEKSKACSVSAYVADNPSGRETIEFIENKINEAKICCRGGGFPPVEPYKSCGQQNAAPTQPVNYGSLEMFIAVINEEDWAENWKKYFNLPCLGRSAGRI